MDILGKIVSQMTREEIRFFKIYSTRMIHAAGRKDLRLFDDIRKKQEQFNDDLAARKLYGKKSGSYYRLKHRLTEDLNDYLVLHYYGKEKIHNLNRDWALFNIHMKKRNFELAHHFLKKAEKKAIALESYEMLNLIYSSFVLLSTEVLSINPEEYIKLRKGNATQLSLIHEMDQALALISHRLRTTQNFSKEDVSLTSHLNKALLEFNNHKVAKKSRSFQIRIYRAISQILLQRHRYRELSEYLLKIYTQFEKEKWFDKDTHDIKLQVLTYITNSFYRTGNFRRSLQYGLMLGEEIKAYNGIQYDKYLFFFYNALLLNYMKTDLQKALSVIYSMEQEMKQRKISYYDQFIYVNKAIIYHWQNKPDIAIQNLVKLYLLDSFKMADIAFQFKIVTAEIIMQFDAGEPLSFSYRLKFIRKKYMSLLSGEDFEREKTLFHLMETMLSKQDYKRDKLFLNMAKKFIRQNKTLHDDESVIINYGEWLKKKIL